MAVIVDLDVMLAKPVQAQALASRIEFPVCPDFGVAVAGGPFGDIGVKAFAVLHDRREQQQVTALAQLAAQAAAQFIARLRFDRDLAIRAILRPQPRV